MLLNLVTNAIKYNRPGGHVRIDAQALEEQVLLRVSDTGRGLTAEQLSRLFDPFDRLGAESTSVEGTGIGMTIVKGLVERMNGTLEVHSTPDVGTTFELRLWAARQREGSATLTLRKVKIKNLRDWDRTRAADLVQDNWVRTDKPSAASDILQINQTI